MAPADGSAALLAELVGLARQGREAGLQEVVDPGRRQRPRQQPAEARRENLRDRKPGSRPRTDTTAACEEFANRLADIAAFDRLLVSLVRMSRANGSRRKLVTSSPESVLAALNDADESTVRSRKV